MSFSNQIVLSVWQKGFIDQYNNPLNWRKDQCTAWIHFSDYGNRDSVYGWEIDHVDPNGGDELSNLRPLHWINNVEKSDGNLQCPIISESVKNIRKH